VLSEAYRSGVTLAGVSAGAVCWFDAFLFNSGQGPMRPLSGLGLIPMGACPHYTTETDRRAALQMAVAAGKMPTTLAIDDGVAVAFDYGARWRSAAQRPAQVPIASAERQQGQPRCY